MKRSFTTLLLALCSIGAAESLPGTPQTGPATAAAATGSASDRSLSFAEALDLMTANNHHLQAARHEEERRVEEQKAARGLRWPRLDLAAFATAINDPIVMDLEPIRDVILQLHPDVPPQLVPPFETTILDDQFSRALLNFTWPIYTGGKIKAANAAAAAEVENARQIRSQAEHKLLGDLVQRYFGLRLAEAARDVHLQVLKGTQRHVWEASRLEEEGMIARAERLHAEAVRAMAAAEHDVQLAAILPALAISTVFRHRETALQILLFTSLPAVFLAGFSWPKEMIPGWLKSVSLLLPSTPAIAGFLRINQMGATLSDVAVEWSTLWILAGLYFVLAWLAHARLRFSAEPDKT